jgi:epoxyqueuosine reductase
VDGIEVWTAVSAAAGEAGWTVRAAGVHALREAAGRVHDALQGSGFSAASRTRLAKEVGEAALADWGDDATVVVGATPRPLTRATLTVGGTSHEVVIPPHYAGYATVPDGLTAVVQAAVAPFGRRAARIEPPLKTLAAGTGLARYGRNNITYVLGLGSYLMLAACVTDAPPSEDASWAAPQELERCAGCSACLRACPTGAILPDRFLLDTERCLTWVNEDHRPFPSWVEPAWHTCAVGCLRCQQVCPENASVDLVVAPPEEFDEAETAAILAGTPAEELGAETVARLRRCGLDYDPALIARNLRALLPD